jgi:hypothetical protein
MPYDNTSQRFQTLILTFVDASTVAADDAGLQSIDAQIINSSTVALKNTGVLERLIHVWTKNNSADCTTWLQCKIFFQPWILDNERGMYGHSTYHICSIVS